MHVHDPVRLLVQSYDMLRPEDVIMLMHGFPVSFSAAEHHQWDATWRICCDFIFEFL